MSCPQPANLTLLPVGFASNLHYYYDPYPVHQDLKPPIMPLSVLENALQQLLEYSYNYGNAAPAKIIWQGGEPILAGLDYFRTASDLIEKYSQCQRVEQYFYTNGTLITPEWMEFFESHRITPVIYVHGPEQFYKKDIDKRYPMLEEALENMLRYRIPFRTCSAILNSSCTYGSELYDFLSHYAFNMGFYAMTPALLKESGEFETFGDEAILPEGYGDFFSQVFDAWEINGRRFVHIQQFDAIMRQLDDKPRELCSSESFCYGNTAVNINGDVYPCIRSIASKECLGHIEKTPLTTLWQNSQKFASLKTMGITSDCRYAQWCFCGCPKDRVPSVSGAGVQESYLCKGYAKFLKKVIFLGR